MSRLTAVLKSIQKNHPKVFVAQTYKLYEVSFIFHEKNGPAHSFGQVRFSLQGGWSAINDYMKKLLELMNQESNEHGVWSMESVKALDQEVFCVDHEMVNLARRGVDTTRVLPWELHQQPEGLKELFYPKHHVHVFTNVEGEDWIAYIHLSDFSVSFTSCDLDYDWQTVSSILEVKIILGAEERRWLNSVLEMARTLKAIYGIKDHRTRSRGTTIELTPEYALSFVDSYIQEMMLPDNFYGIIERKIRCESIVYAFIWMGVLTAPDAGPIFNKIDSLTKKLEEQRQKREQSVQRGGVEPGDWGRVEILKGKHKGKTGEYDDDDEGKAVVITKDETLYIPYKFLFKLEP